MTPKTIGRRIRQLRKRTGMSVPRLGKAAGIDRSDMWRIEQGEGPESMGLTRLTEIAKALGVPLAALFTSSDHDRES